MQITKGWCFYIFVALLLVAAASWASYQHFSTTEKSELSAVPLDSVPTMSKEDLAGINLARGLNLASTTSKLASSSKVAGKNALLDEAQGLKKWFFGLFKQK